MHNVGEAARAIGAVVAARLIDTLRIVRLHGWGQRRLGFTAFWRDALLAMKQQKLAMQANQSGNEPYSKPTCRDEFLATVEAIVP